MAFGIYNQTNVTIEQINSIGNFTDPTGFFINVNNIVYEGWLYFVLLLALWVIISIIMQRVRDQLLNNIMYGGAIITVISLLMRGIFIIKDGLYQGLLTDKQMWIFPVITILLMGVIWAIKKIE